MGLEHTLRDVSSWTSCTVAPAESTSPAELRDALADGAPAAVREHARTSGEQQLPPWIVYEQWGACSLRISPGIGSSFEELFQVLLAWIEPHAEDVAVAYLIRVSDTSGRATIQVYEPGVDGLRRVEEREATVHVHWLKCGEDEFFPEHAMVVYAGDRDDVWLAGALHHLETIENHLDDLEAEYGCRPLLHYGGTS